MEKLSWDDLANLYDKYCNGFRARTLPMEKVFSWAKSRKDLFTLNNDGSLTLKEINL